MRPPDSRGKFYSICFNNDCSPPNLEAQKAEQLQDLKPGVGRTLNRTSCTGPRKLI